MEFNYVSSNIKVTEIIFVSLYQNISLNAKAIWFSFTIKYLIDPRKVFNFFGGKGTTTLSRETAPAKEKPLVL